MERMEDLSPSEQAAWKQGFLFGMQGGEFLYEHELMALDLIPYPPGSAEYARWLHGYQSNAL